MATPAIVQYAPTETPETWADAVAALEESLAELAADGVATDSPLYLDYVSYLSIARAKLAAIVTA